MSGSRGSSRQGGVYSMTMTSGGNYHHRAPGLDGELMGAFALADGNGRGYATASLELVLLEGSFPK